MRIQDQVLADAIALARNWAPAPISIFMGTTRADPDPSDLRGRQTATRGERPWWAPGPARLLATVRETATGIEIVSAL